MSKPELILIRGLPGSGKSTLARKFVGLGYQHFEADMFFGPVFGEPYRFNPDQLKDAHAWCQGQTKAAIDAGYNVVVSNTFTRLWELEPYLKVNAHITVIKCEGSFSNIHGVPQGAIDRMKMRWEEYNG